MKIKDESELANILAMAFSRHANQIQNGAVEPYLTFMTGTESIDVTITLNGDGTITVKPIETSTPKQAPKEEPEPEQTEVERNPFSALPGVTPT